jgi:hypothetical protein
MITEPSDEGQRTPLQDVETLYIGGAEPVIVHRVRVVRNGLHQDYARLRMKFTTTMARTSWVGPMEQHEVER